MTTSYNWKTNTRAQHRSQETIGCFDVSTSDCRLNCANIYLVPRDSCSSLQTGSQDFHLLKYQPRRRPWQYQSDSVSPGLKLPHQKYVNFPCSGVSNVDSPITNASVDAIAIVRTIKNMATARQEQPLRSLVKVWKPGFPDCKVFKLLCSVPDSCFNWVVLLKTYIFTIPILPFRH